MPVEFAVRVLDTVVGVELDGALSADLHASILAQWAHLRVSPDGRTPAQRWRLMLTGADTSNIGDVVPVVASDEESAADQLATELTLAGLRALAGKAFLVHAAGLALDDGRVVAFVGPSGRGKTTLARHLGSDFGYVSDETIAFRSDLSVVPYPKPLSIGSRPGVKQLYSPVELGLRPATGPLRLGALVLLERDAAVTEPRVEAVPLAEALGELVPQMSSLARIPDPLHGLADVIAATGGVRRLVYGGAEDLRALVSTILRTRGGTHARTDPSVGEIPVEAPTGTIARAPYVDALDIDDQLAVLATHRLHILDGIGPALWCASDGVSIAQLETRIASIYGPRPDGTTGAAVAEAIEQLVAAGILHVG
ncbi:P-loop NTPase family protein [Rathayibacter soli]|uniref:hypothetical protein n=1 Tax=Rathayibacter soli TaxID=3144168 RepID=UPI0027E3BBAF|nr:hypothetical protein [Glaciibacter superstes]